LTETHGNCCCASCNRTWFHYCCAGAPFFGLCSSSGVFVCVRSDWMQHQLLCVDLLQPPLH
jgi:hypothetical protein